MSKKHLYKKVSRLVNLSEKPTVKYLFRQVMLVALAFILFASLQSLSLNNVFKPGNSSPKNTWGIQEFSLSGTMQFGKAVVSGDKNNFIVTVNVKPDTNTASVKPLIKLVPGATISPAIGQAIAVNKLQAYKVTLPTGEVQNWTIKTVHEKPDYTSKIFKAGDRVLFAGNSITHGGRYHQYIWLYYMTRFPNMRLTILNGGIGGDIISNINNRLEEDIFTKNPNIINLTFGMNDSGYFQYMSANPQKVADDLVFKCDSAFKLVVIKLKNHPDIKKILMTGSPYDVSTKVIKNNEFKEKPATFERIVQLQKDVAKANNWPFINIYHPMDSLNKVYQKGDANFTLSGSNDRIHPESYGHLVWTYYYLRSQGLNGLEVADFTVDAARKKATASNNCAISNINGSTNAISFDYFAKSLPFPIDETKYNGDKQPASVALKYVPFTNDMNQEMLRVKNLSGKNYELKIDGKAMGRFAAAELANGINMALITTTPQYLQAMNILKLNEERGSTERETRDYAVQVYNFARPNGIKNDQDPASWTKMRELKKTNGWINNDLYERGSNPATQKAWQEKMDRLTNEIYASNKPTKHKVELVKVD